jgi:2-polyprenyl-3-methyl-5-hydroxy-6-metoxy-1,4-benzoquinol methylase
MPPYEELAALYEGDYFGRRGATGYDDYAEQEEEYGASFQEEVRLLRRYLTSGRVLDVGCGYGYFLEAAEAAGFEGHGIDVSAKAVQETARRLPGRVHHGDVRDCPALGPEEFDVVFVSHLIEHIPEPVSFVAALSRILKASGIAIFVTPNIHSPLARLSRSRWVSLKVPEHVAYYNPETIRRLLEEGGLEVIGMETAHQHYRLAFIGEKVRALLHPASLLIPPIERLAGLRNRMVRIPNGSMRVIGRKAPGGRRAASV